MTDYEKFQTWLNDCPVDIIDYQRMSRSGREVYDEIQQLHGGLPENAVWMEID